MQYINFKFLKLFETRHKGFITNLFLKPIREGLYRHDEIIDYIRKDLKRRERYGLSNHLKILNDNLENEHIDEFIRYYVEYSKLPYEERKVVKKIKAIEKRKFRELKDFINDKRPLSWSAISSFEFDPKQFYDKYILGQKQQSNSAMEFGKIFGDKIAKDKAYLPEIPRYSEFEKKLLVNFSGIPLVGFIDSYDPKTHSFYEYKTSKSLWSKEKALTHGQLKMYALGLYITYKVNPENLNISLICIKTKEDGGFNVSLCNPLEIVRYDVKLTMRDILEFASYIKKTYEAMQKYVKDYE